MVAGRTMPWLRPARAAEDPARFWVVAVPGQFARPVYYRDAVVLNRDNEVVAVQNFTEQPIASSSDSPANRQLFRSKLLAAANPPDEDSDGLPDDWERGRFGDLEMRPQDSAPNGLSVLETYAFSHGVRAISPEQSPAVEVDAAGHLIMEFPVRIGRAGGWSYVVELSDDFRSWRPGEPGELNVLSAVLPHDGRGTWRVRVATGATVGGGAPRGLRVKILRQP